MANDYSTLVAIRARLALAVGDTAEDAILSANLEAASRGIDLLTDRTYYAATSTRYYNATSLSGPVLNLGTDLLTVTTLTNGDGTALAAASYVLQPRNYPPYRTLRLKSNFAWTFTDADSEISVAGTWGSYSSVPANIAEACILLTLRLFRRKDSPLGILGFGDLGNVVRVGKLDPDVMALLPAPRAWVV